MSNSKKDQEEDLPGAKFALITFTLLNAFNYADRYVGSAMKDLIAHELQLSDVQTGLPLTAFILVYMIAAPLAAWVSDTGWLTRRSVLISGVLCWTLLAASTSLVSGFWSFLLIRALMGIGEAAYSTCSVAMLSEFFGPRHVNRAISIYMTAIPVGVGLGFLIGGVGGSLVGWRWTFVVSAAFGFSCVILLLFLRDPRDLSDRPHLLDPSSSPGVGEEDKEPFWRVILLNPLWLLAALGMTAITFGSGGMADWLPTFLSRERGLDLSESGLAMSAVVVIGGTLGTALGGTLTDRLTSRWGTSFFTSAAFLVSALSLLPSVICLLLVICLESIASPWQFLSLLFLFQLFLWFYSGSITTLLVQLVPVHTRSRAYSVAIILCHLLGDALSPPLIGLISDRTDNLTWGVLCIPISLILALFLWFGGFVLSFVRSTLSSSKSSFDQSISPPSHTL